MRRIVVDVSEDLADRLNSQATNESRPLKWHIIYLLERAAPSHGRPSVGELASDDAAEVCRGDDR